MKKVIIREPVISDDVSKLYENEVEHQLVPNYQDLQDFLSDSEVLPNTQSVAVAVTKEKVKKKKSDSKEKDTDKKKKKKIYDVEEGIRKAETIPEGQKTISLLSLIIALWTTDFLLV